MLVLPFTTNIDDSALELYTDYSFNWTLNLALYQMEDVGVIANVHRYRSLYLRLRYMQQENACLTWMLLMIQKEQEAHNKEINNFVNDILAIWECLINARVMSCLALAYRQLAVQSTIPNHLYAQTFEATMLNSAEPHPSLNPTNPHPGTPCPPLRPTNPEPPSPEPLIVHITTPANMFMPGAMPVPPPVNYTAGNPHGPHHMPLMFDEENTRNPLPPRHHKFTREPKGHCCKYCGAYRRHWNNHCPEPHKIYDTKERCIVPLEHSHFNKACHWGERTCNNFPVEDRHIRRATRRKKQCHRIRNASVTTLDKTIGSSTTSFTLMDIVIDNMLPPEDSLLFFPNPVTVFDSKGEFQSLRLSRSTTTPWHLGQHALGHQLEQCCPTSSVPLYIQLWMRGRRPPVPPPLQPLWRLTALCRRRLTQ